MVFWVLYTAFYLVLVIVILLWSALQADIKIAALSPLLFLGLFPLLNAPLDWLSLGVTRSLLYAIADHKHHGAAALLWALLDWLMAVLFLLLICLVMVGAIAALNGASLALGGVTIFDLSVIFQHMHDDPFAAENRWVYVILLSTLLPTAIHLFLVSWAVLLWFPAQWSMWAVQSWEEKQIQHDLAKYLTVSFYWILFAPLALLAPLVMYYLLYWVLHEQGNGYYLGGQLLDMMEAFADSVAHSANAWVTGWLR
ncbi:MAG: hypothetical protein CSB47_02580 [Proteobacteria bacterium]|nr:MAG: hypothetical protein CSB47_02580 [Pseudomonadota bacterium]